MKRIEEFFTGGDKSEFGANVREWPYRVISPGEDDTRIVFATKWNCLLPGLDQHGPPAGVGMIVRYGLPSEHDLAWLKTTIGKRRVLFLGDLDPTDLLIFVWLRSHLDQPFDLAGINDRFLNELGVNLPDSYRIKLGDEEIRGVELLEEVWPDLDSELGPYCLGLLRSGLKIEQEAIVSRLGSSTPILQYLEKRD